MRYDIPTDPETSTSVYDMGAFDVTAGRERALDVFIRRLGEHVRQAAVDVCINIVKDGDESKAYDRGYVMGVKKVVEFIVKSRFEGEQSRFGAKPKKLPLVKV